MTDWGNWTWNFRPPATPIEQHTGAAPDPAAIPKWRPRRPAHVRQADAPPVVEKQPLRCGGPELTPEEHEALWAARRARQAERDRQIAKALGRPDPDADAAEPPAERRAADLLRRDAGSWGRGPSASGVIE